MTKTSNLCYRICSVAPNGIAQSSKLKQAIVKLNHEQKVNFTRFHEEDFADKCDYRIRILLSQYRLLKQKVEEFQRCVRKCTEQEQECIERVLNIMNLGVPEDAEAEPVATSSNALVCSSALPGSSAGPASHVAEQAGEEALQLNLVPASKPEAKSGLTVSCPRRKHLWCGRPGFRLPGTCHKSCWCTAWQVKTHGQMLGCV